jgi:UDP-GlcNAc:undecaprenyl-phosphate GlcNAc-1-phosphate transferase
MRTAAVAFILSMLCAALLTPIVRRLARRFGALDHALSARQIHGQAVPRLGGIAIVVAFYAPLLGLLFAQSGVGSTLEHERYFALGLFVGGLLIAALGVYDDLRGAGAGKKFAVQFLVAGTVYFLGFRVEEIANPFGNPIALGWAALPFTLIWVVGVINAMNLIDGLDGLAGGVALVAVSTIFLVSLQRGQPLMILFCASLGGAILGFLFYNFNPASIFMGDTGSMFLGFILATSSIRTNQKSSTTVAVLIPIIILGLPILDTLLAMSRRAVRGRPLFRADKEHIHHRLLGLGLTHRQAVLVLYGMCVLLGGVALVLTYTNSAVITVTLLSVLAVSLFMFLRHLGYIRFEVNHFLSDQRRRNRALRVAVRPFADRLRRATGPEEIWESVRDASAVFEASAVRLELLEASPFGNPSTIVFSSGSPMLADAVDETPTPTPTPGHFQARFGLLGIRREEGHIELSWHDARTELDRDIEIAVELFCDYVVDAYDRVRSHTRAAKQPTRESRPSSNLDQPHN